MDVYLIACDVEKQLKAVINVCNILLIATKPGEKREQKTKKKEVEFKTAPDGRLIITESSDEEGKKSGSCRLLLDARNSDKIREDQGHTYSLSCSWESRDIYKNK